MRVVLKKNGSKEFKVGNIDNTSVPIFNSGVNMTASLFLFYLRRLVLKLNAWFWPLEVFQSSH